MDSRRRETVRESVGARNAHFAASAPARSGETIVVDADEVPLWRQWLRKLQFGFVGSKYALGIVLILCVTVIWVASSVWIQYIFDDMEYNHPYFLTYFNTTFFSVWNFGFVLSRSWKKIPKSDEARDQPIFVDDPRLLHGGWEDEPARTDASTTAAATVSALGGAGGGDSLRDSLTGATVSVPLVQPGAVRVFKLKSQEVVVETVFQDGSVRTRQPPPAVLDECCDYASESGSCDSSEDFVDLEELDDASGKTVDIERVRVPRVRAYSIEKLWRAAAIFCPFWFLANYLFNLSLSSTSVASNTILSSTSTIWTLLLTYVLLRQPVGVLKWLGVALCVGGIAMVGLSDRTSASSTTRNTVFGNFIALVSAFFYATYTSVLKYLLPDDDRYPMGAVFGAVGVINLICFWPGLVILNVMEWETFAWPRRSQFWCLLLNSLIGTNLSDVLWARSVVLTSPVVATLGLMLTTPLSMVVDYILKGKTFSGTYVAGAVFVMLGFVLANLPLDIPLYRLRGVVEILQKK